MSTAIKYAPRYTAADYCQWKGDWELWDGIAIAMSPSPFGRHQRLLVALASELRASIRSSDCAANVFAELDWIVSEKTVVRPDVTVVCGEEPAKHLQETPALVAEILSRSTRQNDLTFKRELYAGEGVAAYLILDPDSKTIDLLRLAATGVYESARDVKLIELQLCDDCQIQIKSAEVFS